CAAPARSIFLAVVAAGFALAGLLLGPARAQMTPEEHAKHHPGAAQPGPPSPTSPPGATSGGMDDMMKGMMSPGPPPLFPSLMELPSVPPERREALQRQAHARMKAGAAILSDGLDRLSQSLPDNDYAAMQEATGRMREGLEQFESGLAAHRALAEGQSPRQ